MWTYSDPTAKLNSSSYQNWGTAIGDENMGPEPNNFFTDEKCGGANFTEIREGAAGWADWRCSDKFIYMCRMLREWHRDCDVVCRSTCAVQIGR